MRAIGKGSLASILAIGLHGMRMILAIALVGLAAAIVVLALAPVLVALAQSLTNIDIDAGIGAVAGADDFIQIAQYFVTLAVMLFVVNRLLEILKTLRFGSPFVKENADRFRSVGYALLIGEGAKLGFMLISHFLGASPAIHSGVIGWLSIFAVFVLAEVFHEGARMKEEQDLTV